MMLGKQTLIILGVLPALLLILAASAQAATISSEESVEFWHYRWSGSEGEARCE